jgi:diguanylate cyclase
MVLFAGWPLLWGCITLYIGKTASAQMSKSSGQTLYIAAKSISNTLANSLTERERKWCFESITVYC